MQTHAASVPARRPLMHGFSLMELMITISVVAILLGIGVPSFQNFIVANRLTTQTNEIVIAMNVARSEAIKSNRTVRFCRAVSTQANACANANASWRHWIIVNANDEVYQRGSLSDFGGNLRVTSTFPLDMLVFFSDGLARVQGGELANDREIRLCAFNGPDDRTRLIEIGAGSRTSYMSLNGGCS